MNERSMVDAQETTNGLGTLGLRLVIAPKAPDAKIAASIAEVLI